MHRRLNQLPYNDDDKIPDLIISPTDDELNAITRRTSNQ